MMARLKRDSAATASGNRVDYSVIQQIATLRFPFRYRELLIATPIANIALARPSKSLNQQLRNRWRALTQLSVYRLSSRNRRAIRERGSRYRVTFDRALSISPLSLPYHDASLRFLLPREGGEENSVRFSRWSAARR